MLIYIAGSGAMGCRFGASLKKAGEEVILLDHWFQHIDTIQQNGLSIVGEQRELVQIPIMRPHEATRPADAIIVLTKSQELEQMLVDIQPLVGDKTRVLCLLNGLGHLETMRKHLPDDQILMGVTVWTAGLRGPGKVELKGTGGVLLQALTAKGQHFGQLFTQRLTRAGLKATYSDQVIMEGIWKKAMVNGSTNAPCALLDCTVGQLFHSQTGRQLVQQLLKEFITIANLDGQTFVLDKIFAELDDLAGQVAHHYPSMHQDLVQNKRPTEVDYLNGWIAERSAALGLDAPCCRLLTQLIHAREEMSTD